MTCTSKMHLASLSPISFIPNNANRSKSWCVHNESFYLYSTFTPAKQENLSTLLLWMAVQPASGRVLYDFVTVLSSLAIGCRISILDNIVSSCQAIYHKKSFSFSGLCNNRLSIGSTKLSISSCSSVATIINNFFIR